MRECLLEDIIESDPELLIYLVSKDAPLLHTRDEVYTLNAHRRTLAHGDERWHLEEPTR